MSRIVIKYGGSNLRTPAGITKLKQLLLRYEDPVVVVSALYGITDFIEAFLRKRRITPAGIRLFINNMKKRHRAFIEALVRDQHERIRIDGQLEASLKELELLLLETCKVERVPPYLVPRLLSYGERLSALLIAGILDCSGRRCRVAFPEEIGLKARGDLLNASIDLKGSQRMVKNKLSVHLTTIVPGFFGVTEDGSIALLGRGGSDYSAACIAHCLDAAYLDIWKDVRGFLSSDPSIIPDVVRQHYLTYDEAAELAYFGARILHPRTVEPLVDKNIPIRLFSTSADHADPLSVINGTTRVSESVIKSITFSDAFSVLKISGAGVGIRPGVLARVTGILHDHGINISSVITSQIAINLIVGKDTGAMAGRLVRALNLPVIKEVKVLEGTSLLALVGHGMVEQHGVAARAFSVLAHLGINIHLSSMGASDVTTYLVIDREDRDKAITAIHREFFGTKQTSGLRKAG